MPPKGSDRHGPAAPQDDHEPEAAQPPPDSSSSRRFFSVPAPIRRIFDRFPIITYELNELPGSNVGNEERNRLLVFIEPAAGRRGAASFNPQCLRWQAYLKFVGIDFDIVPSNNHASPTGALPFLLAASPAGAVVPTNKLQQWAIEQVHCEEEQQLNVRFSVYASLLDHRIRNAWLYQLYLNNVNFNAVARRFYINPSTSNSIVRAALAAQLQQAAREELLKSSDFIDVSDLEAEAGNAFEALSTLLGDENYFFNRANPGLFDASVFSYTHLILDEKVGWKQNQLAALLSRHPNIVQHRERLLEKYF